MMRDQLSATVEHPARLNCSLEVKFADGDSAVPGAFSGYGAVFGNIDAYGDVIAKGAFRDTLKAWRKKDRLPPMLLQHGGAWGPVDDLCPIGVWTAMEEDDTGLRVEGKLFAIDTDRGKYIHEGLRSKALDGLSIGYVARDVIYGKDPDDPRRTLKKVDLIECSIVTFPANSEARVSQAKSAFSSLKAHEWREIETVLRDEGLSRADAVKAVSGFKNWLLRDAGAPATAPRDEAAAEHMLALAASIRGLTA